MSLVRLYSVTWHPRLQNRNRKSERGHVSCSLTPVPFFLVGFSRLASHRLFISCFFFLSTISERARLARWRRIVVTGGNSRPIVLCVASTSVDNSDFIRLKKRHRRGSEHNTRPDYRHRPTCLPVITTAVTILLRSRALPPNKIRLFRRLFSVC